MNMKKVLYAVGIVLALCIGIIGGYSYGVRQEPTVLGNDVQQSASIMFDFGDGRVKTYTAKFQFQDTAAFALTSQIARENSLAFDFKKYEGMGTLITQIGDKKNGENNKYWQYWVNNESPQIGADKYIVKAGSVIEWKFIAYSNE